MLTTEALRAYGADTRAGLAQCLNDERLYLGLVEMLMNDRRFDELWMAVQTMEMDRAIHEAHALSDIAASLALTPLVEQLDMMILCLQIKGDSAVLEKQLNNLGTALEKLRKIDLE